MVTNLMDINIYVMNLINIVENSRKPLQLLKLNHGYFPKLREKKLLPILLDISLNIMSLFKINYMLRITSNI